MGESGRAPIPAVEDDRHSASLEAPVVRFISAIFIRTRHEVSNRAMDFSGFFKGEIQIPCPSEQWYRNWNWIVCLLWDESAKLPSGSLDPNNLLQLLHTNNNTIFKIGELFDGLDVVTSIPQQLLPLSLVPLESVKHGDHRQVQTTRIFSTR